MLCKSISTEERIKEAAKKVFLEKGYEGTTTRDIAKEAGLNIALMNYYFRSKEKLFIHVYEDLLELFCHGMVEVINKTTSLKEKIIEVIDHDFKMFKENPHLSTFIHNELQRDPERVLKIVNLAKTLQESVFQKQLTEAIARGEARDIEMKHVMMLMVGNVQFIFHSKIMNMRLWSMNEAQFEQFASQHIEHVKKMFIDFLFTKT